jgi:hypothetical protein
LALGKGVALNFNANRRLLQGQQRADGNLGLD